MTIKRKIVCILSLSKQHRVKSVLNFINDRGLPKGNILERFVDPALCCFDSPKGAPAYNYFSIMSEGKSIVTTAQTWANVTLFGEISLPTNNLNETIEQARAAIGRSSELYYSIGLARFAQTLPFDELQDAVIEFRSIFEQSLQYLKTKLQSVQSEAVRYFYLITEKCLETFRGVYKIGI